MSAGTPSTSTVSITDDDDPAVTVSFGAADYAVEESDDTTTVTVRENEATVTVTLSADPERTVVIPITKRDQGGATSGDYSGIPTSVTFEAGDTSKTFTFAATHDTVDDDDESVLLGFGTLPARVTAESPATSTVSITDDDDPAVTVSFGSATYSATEGGTVTVMVALSADPEREVVIPLSRSNQGTTTNADYSGVPDSVTFSSGDTSEMFTFRATEDTVDDDDESVLIGFGTLPAGVSAGATDETTVSIVDDDDPTVTVSFGSATYTAAEGSTVMVTVTLSADPERRVTIPITRSNQNGASNSDYSGVPGSVTFNSGDTSKTFTVAATDDTFDDDDEWVRLGFGTLPAGVTGGTQSTARVDIGDDDDPAVRVSFGRATHTVAEGDDVTVTVSLSADPEREVIILLTTSEQDGASDGDYSGVPANVTFNSGDTRERPLPSPSRRPRTRVDDDGESQSCWALVRCLPT